jgi:anti-sigma factor RsiW
MEMDRTPTPEDLLAFRDGELDDVELEAQIGADPQARAELARLIRVKAELAGLPPVTPPPAVWEAIEERTRHHRRPWLQRFPLATAASVFLAAALTIVLWDPAAGPDSDTSGPQVQDPLAQLMLRSQSLESELFTRASASVVGGTSSERALLYGIADVDAQLNALYESGGAEAAERERLWRQRVMLLESLADVQRGQAILRPAIY